MFSDTDTVVKYISCYFGYPVIAISHIDSYDGNHVTFLYDKHENNSYVEKTVPVLDFISLLIQHIPEKHFKMTRYYVLYARHRESDEVLRRTIHKSKHWILLDFNKWLQILFYPLVTTLSDAQNVTMRLRFWNSVTNISLFLFPNYMKGQWQNIIATPGAKVLAFFLSTPY